MPAHDPKASWDRWYAKPGNRQKHYARIAKNRKERRARWQALKAERGCDRCSESNPVCLDWHHRDPSSKVMGVAEMIRRDFARDKILAEIAKCDLLCANCHRKEHAGEAEVEEAPAL